MQLPQSPSLTLYLHMIPPDLLEPLHELFSQAEICVSENISECNGMISTLFSPDTPLPYLSLESLSKPFRFSDLLPLLHNLPHTRVLTFFHFSLDVRERALTNLLSSQEDRLTGKECQLLCFFYQHLGQEISKNRLLKEIWEYHPDTETHTLETHIYRLRQKLEDDPSFPKILLNCKDGYIFKDPIRE